MEGKNSFFKELFVNMFQSFASEHESLFLSYVETLLLEDRTKFIIEERKEREMIACKFHGGLFSLNGDGIPIFWDDNSTSLQFSFSFCWTARSVDAPRSMSDESSDAPLAEDDDSEHVEMSHCVKKQFVSNVKICLCDSMDYFMHQSDYFVRLPKRGGRFPHYTNLCKKLKSVYPSIAEQIEYQILRLWWQKREKLGDESLIPKNTSNQRPSMLSFYEPLIRRLLNELIFYGIPVGKNLLWAITREAIMHDSDDIDYLTKHLVDKVRSGAKVKDEETFIPSYHTFIRWLSKMDISMKSTRNTPEGALPTNLNDLARDMLLRICYYVGIEWNDKVISPLLINMDETAVAYNSLAERGLTYQGQEAHSIAVGDKRSATLVTAASLSGDLVPPFVIWNGKEAYKGAHVKTYDTTVQYQTERKKTRMTPVSVMGIPKLRIWHSRRHLVVHVVSAHIGFNVSITEGDVMLRKLDIT